MSGEASGKASGAVSGVANGGAGEDADRPHGLQIGRYAMPLPRTRAGRIVVGSLLLVGGVLGFLPVLGFWMVPLGLAVLARDIPAVRRWHRRLVAWWLRRKRRRARARAPA